MFVKIKTVKLTYTEYKYIYFLNEIRLKPVDLIKTTKDMIARYYWFIIFISNNNNHNNNNINLKNKTK